MSTLDEEIVNDEVIRREQIFKLVVESKLDQKGKTNMV